MAFDPPLDRSIRSLLLCADKFGSVAESGGIADEGFRRVDGTSLQMKRGALSASGFLCMSSNDYG